MILLFTITFEKEKHYMNFELIFEGKQIYLGLKGVPLCPV